MLDLYKCFTRNIMYSEKRNFGNKSEEIACKFLESKGYSVVERNYLKKYGEIDIVVSKANRLIFIEVKSVSCENVVEVRSKNIDEFRPEDNISPKKLKSLARVIWVYLSEKRLENSDWSFGVVAVKLDELNKTAKVKFIEDIVL